MGDLHVDVVATVLLDLAVILVLTRAVGAALGRLGQPAVVGEIIAGVALGPSLIGSIRVGDSTLGALMFPPEVLQQLSGLANLGLVIFMMIVGLELNLKGARGNGTALVISASSVLLPLGMGAGLGVWLYAQGLGGTSLAAFALFLGVAMSITAFPVLARILVERRLHRTPLGVLVLACAGVDDVLAWSLLALATAIAGGHSPWAFVRVVVLLAVFCLVLLRVVRPALGRLARWHERVGRLTPPMLATILVGLSLSAAATEIIGVHFVFGAFLFGAAVPRENSAALIRDLLGRLEQVAVLVLLPVFFVVTGLAVNIRVLRWHDVLILAVVLFVACVGKFVGAAGAARAMRVPTRQALAVGVLMNTRGLTELVVVTIGYQAHILSRELLTIMVMMAIITTLITKPALRVVYPDKLIARDVADAERGALGVPPAYRCVVVIEDIAEDAGRVGLARDLLPAGPAAEVVVLWLVPLSVPRFELASALSHDLGQMTARLEQVNALADRFSSPEVTCSVICRPSDDVPRDLLAQIEILRPDCVIAGENLDDPTSALDLLPGTGLLLLVRGQVPEAGPTAVTVSLGGGVDAAAVLDLGVRLAACRGTTLRLADVSSRRRWSRAAALERRFVKAGVDAVMVRAGDSAGGLHLTERDGPADPHSPAEIFVYASKSAAPPAWSGCSTPSTPRTQRPLCPGADHDRPDR